MIHGQQRRGEHNGTSRGRMLSHRRVGPAPRTFTESATRVSPDNEGAVSRAELSISPPPPEREVLDVIDSTSLRRYDFSFPEHIDQIYSYIKQPTTNRLMLASGAPALVRIAAPSAA